MKVNFSMKLKILSLLITITLLLTVFVPFADATSLRMSRIMLSTESFSDPSGVILGVSSKGEWGQYPENTLPAIIEAAKTEIDFVAVDVKRTLDGQLILFSDDTTERMLDSEDIFTVADTDYSVLSVYNLRNACGGSNEKVTDIKIPTLSEALDTAKENDIPLIIRCSASLIPEVTAVLSDKDALSMAVIMTDGKIKDINEALSHIDEKPVIAGSIKGNVIFNILSYVNGLEGLEAAAVELKTGNRYGINYYRSLLNNYGEKLRIIADPTTPEISGYREDSEMYWDDLISRGYSVIITDHAERFSQYKENCTEQRAELQEIYDKYVTNHTLPDFKDEILSDIKKAYTDAVAEAEILLGDNSSSLRDMQECYSKLFKAANDVNKNFSALEDGSAGTTVTPVRIALCVIAVAVVVIVQIYFFKRRKKAG